MRELTDKEKYIVKGLFDRKNNFKLEELRTTKLLRDNLDCFALRWELAQRKRIKIYMKKEDAEDITELNKQYFKICDFLYFMNELEENHYIELQTISFANDTSKLVKQALYDTSKYQYGLPKDIEYSGNLDCFYEIADKGKRLYAVWKSHATLTLLAKQDLAPFGCNMIDPLKSWCWGSILFYPFKISRFS